MFYYSGEIDSIGLAGVLVVPPGTRYQYTNIGYGIFHDMVSNTAGENIKKFIIEEIIEPLGLEHTAFFDSAPSASMIVTQNADDGVLPVAHDAEGYTPLYSTAGDLVRFGMFHLEESLLPGASILSDSSIEMLWRFDACIPYLHPLARHDEVILTIWPQGKRLIGHAAAAKEKNFGRDENYVLPQYVELTR